MSDSMRSLSSFGVAGLISAQGEVFYTNDLRARNVGRISDLVSAQIRGTDSDELKVRTLLTYGTFQCYSLRGILNHHDEAVSPASVEVGVDLSYLAVAISFHWERNQPPKWFRLADRVTGNTPEDEFERVLEWMCRHATQVIIRYEPNERRIEIVSLLSRTNSELRDPIQIIQVDSLKAPHLEVSQYRELGDLNYTKLLKNPVTATIEDGLKTSASSEIFIGGDTEKVEEEIVNVPGATNAADEEVIRLGVGKVAEEAEELRALVREYEKTIGGLRESLSELQVRLEEAENCASEKRFTGGAQPEAEAVTVVSSSAPKEGKEEWGMNFLKQVWPFASNEDEEKPEEEAVTVISGGPAPAEEEVKVFGAAPIAVEEEPMPLSSAEEEANRALLELQELARQKRSSGVDSTLEEIRNGVDEEKANRWIDSLSSELLQEKSKLSDLQKVLTKQIRQRELEFKAAERSLQQEVKKANDSLRQKDSALVQKNEQIAQLNLAVERAGTASNDKESQGMKVKLDRAQRMAQMKEEEAKALITKTRDLENRLIVAQAKAQKGNDPQIQQKMIGLEKKVDEYKRINQRLMDSMNQTKDKSGDKEAADLRRKLEQLDRQVNESKRNLDKSSFRVRELQESERKLQTDLARAVEENRNLRKTQARGSGESGGQAA